MRPATLLTARISKDGKRVLCGNRQCRYPGLAYIIGEGKSPEMLQLDTGLDRRRDGIYAFTNRPMERTNHAFRQREGLKAYGESSGLGIVLPLVDLGIVRRSKDYKEQTQVSVYCSSLKDEPITVRCPSCRNCTLITEQSVTRGVSVNRILKR